MFVILKVICKVTMIGNAPLIELFIQPRMLLENNMRINIFTKTLMPHVYKRGIIGNDSANDGTNVFRLEPYDTLEIFSPGKSCIFAFKCADIPVGHLKSDDFFGVEKYPVATFKVKKSTAFKNNKATLTGDLTIKEKTNEISFEITKNNNEYSASIEVLKYINLYHK